MVSTFISLLDIQSWWEIPCIAHFCSLFSSAFNLPDIDIEDLESALLTDGTEDTVGLLPELIVCLLKGCDALKNRNEITTSNYQMFLRRYLRHQCRQHNTKNYFDTDIDFQSLPLRNKLLILYSLCHFRLESNNVQTILANLEADSLRVEPLGYDSKSSGYWYFYGTRLYREDRKPGGKSTVWQVICFTEEDWSNLASKFQNSTSPKERALYKILAENFIPKLPQLFRERERLRRRKLLQVRYSARIHNIAQDKQKNLSEKLEIEEVEKEKPDDLKLPAVNKFRTRSRRRSQSTSTASGISTYASSLRVSSPSSDFLPQHGTFCLSPGLDDVETEVVDRDSSLSNQNSSIDDKNDCLDTKRGDTISSSESTLQIDEECQISRGEEELEVDEATDLIVNENSVECPLGYADFGAKSTRSITNKRNKRKRKSSSGKCRERNHCSSKIESASECPLAEKVEAMAPTTNLKLPGRQTNNSLSSIPENLFLSTLTNTKDSKTKTKSNKASAVNTKSKDKAKDKKEEKKAAVNSTETSSTQKKKKNKSSETYTEKDEILQIGMHKVLLYVKNHRDAWPFMDPVDEEIAPRYYSIIRRPMDLLKMEEKLDNEEYKKYSEFRNDFKLIVNNCRLYNGQNNEYTEMVNNLQEAFDKATKKYLDQQSSDEDECLEYPDPRTNVFREKAFNKVNTSKIAQKEMSKDVLRKEKEKEKIQATTHDESEKLEDDDVEKPPENRSGKKKRKDKDKRRKKKSKGKTQISSVGSGEEGNMSEISGEESDATSIAPVTTNRSKKRPGDMSKLKDSMLPPKRTKTKSLSIENEQSESEMPAENKKKQTEKRNRKETSSSRQSDAEENGSVERKEVIDEEQEGSDVGGTEKEQIRKPNKKPLLNSKRKHSLNDDTMDGIKKKAISEEKEILATNKTQIREKINQNEKSKTTKTNSNIKESMKKDEVEAPKTRQTKDNKKTSSSGAGKKRKGRRKKLEQTQTIEKDMKEEGGKLENEVEEDESISRSSSPPLFKVDLHEKYAKSASIKDEESSCDELKCESESPVALLPKKINQEEDLTSITSQSLSRSPSPFNSAESDAAESEKSKEAVSSEMAEDKLEGAISEQDQTAYSGVDSIPSSFFYLDKYDLIKQRRNRNTEEKWNQIVKEAEKIKDNKKASSSNTLTSALSKEKNQKLKETIEKLKVKNAKSKERSVLIDEIFGVKPAQQPRDEKTIYEKLRDSSLDAKTTNLSKKNIPPVTPVVDVIKVPAQDAYEFVDELEPPKVEVNKKPVVPSDKVIPSAKKVALKKETISKTNVKKAVSSSNNKTNLEALELETEQTLKDINRWLEHTPRFPEFSSASNSPSRYNLLDDFDAVASKIDPADFRRPVSISASKLEPVGIDEIADNNKQEIIEDLIPPVPTTNPVTPTGAVVNQPSVPGTGTLSNVFAKPRESSGATQFLAHPPPPPHVKSQQQKESKRRTLKEKLSGCNRRKDILRTIDRMQPGKAKGNLIGSMHSGTKTEDMFPPAATNKIKEVKNSLVVKTDESGPKLSMGSVLQTEEFSLGQLHNFSKTETENKLHEDPPHSDKIDVDEEPTEKLEVKKEELDVPKVVEDEKLVQKPSDKFTATPNLSAWFKAFGTPKKAKKVEEEEKKASEASSMEAAQNASDRANCDQGLNNTGLNIMKSPPTSAGDTFSLPAPRQRKASTGSTVSERSSFSQDPDSPRVGIDDRFGAYAGPYPSPIGASPIMVSPKPDEIGKPTSPYPLNGAIKVGFYQDTTTKSSPEKSCSPRELPSPYPQYSQHLYSTSSSPTVNVETTNTFSSCYNTGSETNKTQGYTAGPASALFDQYKQPRSQESDYNSMSPNTNSNSPYQQPQTSPYQQTQNSPYQQQSSPYQQPQNSPFQNNNTSNMMGSSPNSPNMPQTPQQPQNESPRSQPQSPYHQQTNSPYQQSTNSPYHQNSTPPYQQSVAQQQPQPTNMSFLQQQQPQSATTNQATVNEVIQRQPSVETFRPEPPSYSIQDANAANQFKPANRTSMSGLDSEITAQTKNDNDMLNKIQQNADWNPQINAGVTQTQQSERSSVSMANLNSITQEPTQLNTPPLQTDALNSIQNEKSNSLQFSNYPQFTGSTQKDSSKAQNMFVGDMTLDMNIGMHNHQPDKNNTQGQTNQGNLKIAEHEPDILNLGGYSDSTSRQRKNDQVPSQLSGKDQYESLQKHQQMFDSFLGSMTNSNKNIGLGKSLNDVPSKSFEMFNRNAPIGFTKDFSSPLISGQQKSANAPIPNTHQSQQQPQITQPYQITQNEAKSMVPTSGNNLVQNTNKPLNMASSNYQQQMQQHLSDSVTNKMSTFPTPMSDPANDMNKLQQHPQAQQLTATNYSSNEKIGQESILPPNSRQEQLSQITRSQQLNMDITGYKTYNNPASMLDPLRNLNHPLSMMDESLLGIAGSTTAAGYYDKNIPPAAHMFSKNLSQQMFQNSASYVAPTREQQLATNVYGTSGNTNMNTPQLMENFDAKQPKRKKKKTSAAIVPDIASNLSNMLPTQQQSQIPVQNPQSTQGFQLYSDLKTASSNNAVTDASAISLKTASSMVPGSAFNFGPSPAGLGLPTAMYGDNTGYLDPYYLASSHRTTTEATSEKSNSAAAATAPTTPYQFLAHNPVRPTYPFMNSQLDTNSPIYQQYIQRQEQEIRARMMINQGLLGSTAAAPGSYAQPGYRPPTLGMPKHYDMSRQTWF